MEHIVSQTPDVKPAPDPEGWELVDDEDWPTYRLAVPGGWLYMIVGDATATFVPGAVQ